LRVRRKKIDQFLAFVLGEEVSRLLNIGVSATVCILIL
jgi:hypothetical protein